MTADKNKIHGVISLLLLAAAIGAALLITFNISKSAGLIYSAITITGSFAIIYSFCTKCPCKNKNCGHVFPGMLTKLLPDRNPGKYTKLEVGIVVLSLTAIIVFPQYFLWSNNSALFIFWTLIIIGVIEIRTYVCNACGNQYCPAKK